MELSNDQKAILRLLAQRGADGYDDLTALLGIDAAEVHERAKAAAAQLEADGIPAPSIPAPAAAEPVAAVPEPPKPPAPEPPTEPVAPPSPPPAAAPAKPSRPLKLALPESGGARAALAAGIAIVVALVIVILLSGGGGDSGDSTSTGSTTASGENGSIAVANPKLTQAVLSPVDGGDAKGLATFGRVKNTLALQLEAEGLEPTAKGESYTVWLYDTAKKRLPLASTTVGANGKIGAQVEVPTEVLAYLANETFDQLYLSRTDDVTLKAALAKATKEKKTPIYTGTDVLGGTISGPIVGAAKNAKK